MNSAWMKAVEVSMSADPVGTVLALTLLVFLLGAAVFFIVVLSKINCMSDEERARWGMGPKGQGRR